MGRLENAIGWYHSHPGYGCWLSGIDVSTQMVNQQYQEPFVAIVVSEAVHRVIQLYVSIQLNYCSIAARVGIDTPYWRFN